MNYEPTKEEIDFVKALLDDEGSNFYTSLLVSETLKQTKIFHLLTAIKVLRLKDGEEINLPELDEIKEMLDKILKKQNIPHPDQLFGILNDKTTNGNETFTPDLNREH